MSTPYVFISYAHEDGRDFAIRLAQSLNKEDITVFFDKSIPGGDDWREKIEAEIDKATHMVVVLTPKSLESEWVELEKEIFRLIKKKPIIPAYYKECRYEVTKYEKLQYIDFRKEEYYDESFQELLRALGIKSPRLALPPSPERPKSDWKNLPIIDFSTHIGRSHSSTHASRTPLYCISKDQPVLEALNIMSGTNLRIRHLLVTADGHAGSRLEGMISLRAIEKYRNNPQNQPYHAPVEHIMDSYNHLRFFRCLQHDDTLKTGLEQFTTLTQRAGAAKSDYYMSALPVIDEDHNAIGIISFKDILKEMVRPDSRIPAPQLPIGQCMKRYPQDNVLVDVPETEIAEIAGNLHGSGQRDIPIVEDAQSATLVGMISDKELIEHRFSGKTAKEVMAPLRELQLQTPNTHVASMLQPYLNESYEYFSLLVVDSIRTPQLLGIIRYIEIFKALLSL